MNIGATHYKCSKCQLVKERTAEHFYIGRNGRVTGYCRPCQARWWREYMSTRRGTYNDSRRDYMRAYQRRRNGTPPERYRVGRDEVAS